MRKPSLPNKNLDESTISLAPMGLVDVKAVYAIESAAYHFPWSPKMFEDCINFGHRCSILTHNECVMGYAIISVSAGESHILNICIHPDFQSQGYGSFLMNQLLDLIKCEGAAYMYLEVRISNYRAIRLYRKFGFEWLGEYKNYYQSQNERESAYIFGREL